VYADIYYLGIGYWYRRRRLGDSAAHMLLQTGCYWLADLLGQLGQ
jgi:hypothetical protein